MGATRQPRSSCLESPGTGLVRRRGLLHVSSLIQLHLRRLCWLKVASEMKHRTQCLVSNRKTTWEHYTKVKQCRSSHKRRAVLQARSTPRPRGSKRHQHRTEGPLLQLLILTTQQISLTHPSPTSSTILSTTTRRSLKHPHQRVSTSSSRSP